MQLSKLAFRCLVLPRHARFLGSHVSTAEDKEISGNLAKAPNSFFKGTFLAEVPLTKRAAVLEDEVVAQVGHDGQGALLGRRGRREGHQGQGRGQDRQRGGAVPHVEEEERQNQLLFDQLCLQSPKVV